MVDAFHFGQGMRPLRRGDVVIYEVPLMQGTMYEKRIVALSGDKIEASYYGIMMNGALIRPREETFSMMSGILELVNTASHTFVAHKFIDRDTASVSWQVSTQLSSFDVVNFLNERTMYDYAALISRQCDTNGVLSGVSIKVPDDACFVLGDNTTAYDSRFHGFVPQCKVLHLVLWRF
jgi:signal peptidase I